MRWIIGTSIAVDSNQVRARRDYIHRVTGAEVSAWRFLQVDGQACRECLCCMSYDEIDGTFITAHIDDVYSLCSLPEVYAGKLVVANTCIWQRLAHKRLLNGLRCFNQGIELWFAKQELSIDRSGIFRQSTTLSNIGRFEFQTSPSERELFANRGKGLMEAIRVSFVRVSPIIQIGD